MYLSVVLIVVPDSGSMEDQEYFGGVLMGVRQLIQNHLRDVQGKFHDQFQTLEIEIKRRDDIISQLQNRINELEGRTDHIMTPIGEVDRELGSSNSSSGSSLELPFMVSHVSVVLSILLVQDITYPIFVCPSSLFNNIFCDIPSSAR